MVTFLEIPLSILAFLFTSGQGQYWQDDTPAQTELADVREEVFLFQGNQTFPDYFRLLLPVRDALLVGARNAIFNISLQDLTLRSVLEWPVGETDSFNCYRKGRSSETECHNFIRVLLVLPNGNIFACGTNAFSPVCREYAVAASGQYSQVREEQGVLYSPFDPSFNSTILFHHGDLYSGSFGGFHGSDPLIFGRSLRTLQYDPNHLNDPDFVHSMAVGEHVFVFFRETAVEFTNCGKAIYSRVGRVCSTDQGGVLGQARHRWSTFLKARLNCSIPGEFPFYFDEIQGVTDLVDGIYNKQDGQMLYATFTTGPNTIAGSAVCAFSLQDIFNVFEGPFKHQDSPASNFLAVQGPEPRPGRCSGSTGPADSTWIESHPLMDEAVRTFFGRPFLLRTSFDGPTQKYRFTQIAVDPQVRSLDNETYDVLFVGTDQGFLLKAFNVQGPSSRDPETVIVYERQVFPDYNISRQSRSIRSLRVIRDEYGRWGRLLLVSDEEVRSIPLAHCHYASTCSACVYLRDPYCAWDRQGRKCVELNRLSHSAASADRYVQSLHTGESPRCPEGSSVLGSHKIQQSDPASNRVRGKKETPHEDTGVQSTSVTVSPHEDGEILVSADGSPLYTVETLAVTVGASAVGALLLGFLFGYVTGRRCRKEQYDAGPCVDAEYEFLEQRPTLARVHPGTPLPAHHLHHHHVPLDGGYYTPGHHPVHYAANPTGTLPHQHYAKPMNMVLDINGTSSPATTATIDRRAFYSHAQTGGHRKIPDAI